MPEPISQSDFLEAFGITPPLNDPPPVDPPTDPGDPPPADPPVDPPTDPGDPPPADPTDPPTDPAEPPKDPAPAPAPAPDKSAQAFAQMRVELSKYKKTLDSVAGVLGLDATQTADQLAEAIHTKVLEAQAKKDNLPLEMLQKIDRLEQLETTFQRQQLQTQAALGFENIKKTFSLDDAKVIEFAKELINDGLNPYEQPIDLLSEYRNRNWERLMAEAAEKGKQEEIQRAAKAAAQGTEPGVNTGGAPEEPSKINTIADLDKFFQTL